MTVRPFYRHEGKHEICVLPSWILDAYSQPGATVTSAGTGSVDRFGIVEHLRTSVFTLSSKGGSLGLWRVSMKPTAPD